MKKQKEYKITPEEYSSFLKHVEIENISLVNCQSKINTRFKKIPESLDIIFKHIENQKKIKENLYAITVEFRVDGNPKNSKTNFVSFSATYKILLSSKGDLPDDFFAIYNDLTLPIIAWPFFREYVYSISSKMDIPKLTLPMIKR